MLETTVLDWMFSRHSKRSTAKNGAIGRIREGCYAAADLNFLFPRFE